MYYLYLNIENAGLLKESLNPKTDGRNPVIKEILADLQKEFPNEKVTLSWIKRGHNFRKPLAWTDVCNLMTSLMNGVPTPTKPKRRNRYLYEDILTYPEICVNLAKKAYIKFNTPIDSSNYIKTVIGSDGEYYHIYKPEFKSGNEIFLDMELIKSEKLSINSNVSYKQSFFELEEPDENGNKMKTMLGYYSYDQLLRTFENKETETYRRLFSYINEILGYDDVRKYLTFSEMCKEIYEKLKNDNDLIERTIDFVKSIEDGWKNELTTVSGNFYRPWMCAIFNVDFPNRSNGDGLFFIRKNKKIYPQMQNSDKGLGGKCYLLNKRGVDTHKLVFDATIIIETDDDKVIKAIKENSGVCRCLEGGICSVEIDTILYDTDYKDTYEKIFDE